MRKRIPSAGPVDTPGKRKRTPANLKQKQAWKGEILLYLEGLDPKLLDKETYKIYCRIADTGARIQGPVPLPVYSPENSSKTKNTECFHRRLIKIISPTGKTISLLDKLPLSGSVQASITVEEEDENEQSPVAKEE